MGLLVDRLAVAQERLRQLKARLLAKDDATWAARQQGLIDRLQRVSLGIDGTSVDSRAGRIEAAAVEAAKKIRFPKSRGGRGLKKKGRRKPGRLVWLCCFEPQRTVGRRGKPIWTAACKWKKGDVRGQTTRLVGMGSSKPREIKMKGRKMKRCQKIR